MSFLFTMLHKVRTYINRYKLLDESTSVIVGFSGGADSVALLAILVRLGYRCIAAHCNFHLRGEESERDAAFAENMAKHFDVPFEKIDFDTNQFALEHKLSIEMAARELRYQWFENISSTYSAQAIAVAHHRDDSVETFLLNVIRGTGIHGMTGIRPRNGRVVRPLLCLSREDILAWLEEQQLSYVTDSTNLSDEYTRNFIRLNLIPMMEQLNPSAKESIARTVGHLSEAESLYNYIIDSAKKDIFTDNSTISISALSAYPSASSILYESLKTYNFTRVVCDSIFLSLDGESGKEFFSSTHRVIKDRNNLLISPLKGDGANATTIYFTPGEVNFSLPFELNSARIVINKTFHPKKDKTIAYFDADKLQYPLILRRWKEGDWFIPFGMTGKKKLSDFFTDCKYSLLQKENTWLLCNGNDIIWIVGERTDNRYRVNDSTKEVLELKISR